MGEVKEVQSERAYKSTAIRSKDQIEGNDSQRAKMPPAKRSAAGAVAPKTKKAKTADPSPSTEAPAAVATSTASSSGMIDSRVSEAQAKKAFEALVSHTKRRLASGSAKHDLLAAGDDEEEGADGLKLNGDISEKGEAVWLMVTVKQLNNRKLVKPVRV